MTALARQLLVPLRALILGMTVLCLLAQPVLTSAHELHEIGHVLADESPDPGAAQADDTGTPANPLEGLLHAFDCCLHASAVVADAMAWSPETRHGIPPTTTGIAPPTSPLSNSLRPPISG